ncbi:polycystin-1-like protein 2 [Oratosquilla oratoria]|uniref:polycystin-1-like protein 2 n=1 Tax=Oratosquilla oratoria TaxID=337810 RepID=UPI003F776AED
MAISLPIFYHEVLVERTAAVVNIEVNAEVEDRMIIMVDYEKLPLPENNPLIKLLTDVPLTNKGVRDLLLNDSYVQSRTGRFFVGIASLNEGAEFTKEDLSDLQSRELSQTLTSSYTFRAFTSGCYYFDEEEEEWSSDGLKVVSSNYNETVCETTHFTSFGSGFSPVPQKINFNLIYANAGFTDNLTLYLTLIFSFLSALILFIWARFKDKDDLIKMGVTPLPDNKPEDKYLYELVVFTGSVKEASCKSNIQFILSGDREETVVRNLADNKRTAFHRNGIDSFVMAVPRTLGTLEHLRIWHDNTGPDMYASWHLAFISVRDLQTQENTQFIANRWIGIDRDDGKLDITMESANLDTMGDFSHLYEASKQRNIKDNHLWFSVFYRPRRSRYTRTQRVGVCITFLYLSMVTSLMWYNYDAERTPTDGLILFGPINISTEQAGGHYRDGETVVVVMGASMNVVAIMVVVVMVAKVVDMVMNTRISLCLVLKYVPVLYGPFGTKGQYLTVRNCSCQSPRNITMVWCTNLNACYEGTCATNITQMSGFKVVLFHKVNQTPFAPDSCA